MNVTADADRDRLQQRLVRIEGQVRGVQRMLDEGRDCREVIQQLAAVRAAVHQVGVEVMRTYAVQCLDAPESETGRREALDYVIGTLGRWSST